MSKNSEYELMPGGVEVCVDYDYVSIPITRYDELIRAEAERDVLLRSHQTQDSYTLNGVATAIFGAKEDGGNA